MLLLDHLITSMNDRKRAPNLTSSCVTQKFSISTINGHWIISVVEACDKVLLNGHHH